MPYPAEAEARRRLVEVARWLAADGFIPASDGNLSVRLGPDRILCTPSGRPKGRLREEELLVIALDGRTLCGEGRPSSELQMHLAVYRTRSDVGAVVHAHPPLAVALTLTGRDLETPYLAETVVHLGKIPTVPYVPPGSAALAEAVAAEVATYDAVLLAHHGALTVGRTLEEAYDRMALVEHTARIVTAAHLLGEPRPLPPEAAERLWGIWQRRRQTLG